MEQKESSSILYNLSAVDLLKILGYTKPQTENAVSVIAEFEKKYQKNVPNVLKEYILLAMDNPLLRTADIWTGGKSSPFWFFLYDSIEEMNQEEEEAYPEFAHSPRETWSEMVENYLEIGSDYSAGVVTFGIREVEMEKEDPSVYIQHEADEITEWNLFYQTLSDYLLAVTCDALFGWEYSTSQMKLEENGWVYIEDAELGKREDLLLNYQIDLSKLHKIQSMYYEEPEERIACCYKEEEKLLFLIKIADEEENEIKVVVIKKER